MNSVFNKRFQRLKTRNITPSNTISPNVFCNRSKIVISNIQNIIGLSDVPGGTYCISAANHETYCIIFIHYIHTQNDFDLVANNIRELPPEINRMISEYLPSYITLQIRLDYTDNYPFDAPKWSLISCDDRLASSLKNAEEYYRYIIENHNSFYTEERWSPAIDIDRDILMFIVRINHFAHLFL